MDTKLDIRWYARLLDISTSPDYEWMQDFVKISSREYVRFFQNEVENPRFKCASADDLSVPIAQLHALKEEITLSEKNPYVHALYIEKINFQIDRLRMLECIRLGDNEGFYIHSTALYGKPKKEYFAYVAKRIQDLLRDTAGKTTHVSAHKRLASVFSKIHTSKAITHVDMLPELVLDTGGAVRAKRAREIFLETLMNYEIEGWEVFVDASGDRKRFSVNTQRKTIYIPSDDALTQRRTPLTEIHARALAEHEVGVHVRRAHEGAKQPLMLLTSGLAGYLRGEEGVAGYAQQQVEGATEFYGFDRYLAASLAVGMDGVPRDFRSVYALMRDYYVLMHDTEHDAERVAERAAWDVCVRIFRGTTGQGVGTIFTRDIVYLEGNIGVWHMLSDNPSIFGSLFVGKFDPLNRTHVSALQSLQILPQW